MREAMRERRLETFSYQRGVLFCESAALPFVAREHGTPTYVYSQAELTKNAAAFLDAAQHLKQDCLVCYALKANGSPALLRILSEMGLGADIVSGGELFLALKTGFDPQHIVFSGVGKSGQEIAEAISAGILALHVESRDEQEVVARTAASLGTIAPIAVRVNPDIKVDTHAHVATGQKTHKFGVAPELALEMMQSAQQDPWLRPIGLSAHLGSQIVALDPFNKVTELLATMADTLSDGGLQLEYIDIGGGLAIDYRQSITTDPDTFTRRKSGPSITEWLSESASSVHGRGYRLLVEPGRSIVGSVGLLLTRILYTKNQAGRQLVVTDAGMTDLMRPALYGAHHPIVPVNSEQYAGEDLPAPVDVVGPVCESADVLARNRPLAAVKPGDLLAILQTGAYGFVMSSNYNGRLRPAEVLVNGDDVRCIRRRESYEVLLGDCDPE